MAEGFRRLSEDGIVGDLIPTNGHVHKCRKNLSFNTASAGPAVKVPGEINKSRAVTGMSCTNSRILAKKDAKLQK